MSKNMDYEKIIAEIEYRRQDLVYKLIGHKEDSEYIRLKAMHDAYVDMFAFINTLPDEPISEDERIRKELVNFLQSPFIKENLTDEKVAPWLVYLEKQKDAVGWARQQAYKEGLSDAYKGMPKWRMAKTTYVAMKPNFLVMQDNNILLVNGISNRDMYINLDDLLKLPKEEQKTADFIPEGPKGPSGHPDPPGRGLSDFIQDSLDAIERIYNLDGKDWDVVCNLKNILLSMLVITTSLGYEDLHGKTAKLLDQIIV